jgi:competence protein ComGC
MNDNMKLSDATTICNNHTVPIMMLVLLILRLLLLLFLYFVFSCKLISYGPAIIMVVACC